MLIEEVEWVMLSEEVVVEPTVMQFTRPLEDMILYLKPL